MDKNAIKKYAVWARREMISRVSQRAAHYEITEAGFSDPAADSVLGRVLSAEEKAQRQALIAQIQKKDYRQVMEEAAYTWFNRFIALRFMEVNGYLPSHVRVFTDEQNQFKPQILAEAINMELDGLDMQKVYAYKNANDDDGLFKYMVIVQCNALSAVLPGMFQRISDYTELLFPDNLLREGSVLQQMIELIPEEDWKDQVQIIGWLYQYYNAEKKDEVFAALKKNVKITKENIPAATQLFTPDWIVRYMVENSLGRLWIDHLEGDQSMWHPDDGKVHSIDENDPQIKALKSNWKYYLEEAEQPEEVDEALWLLKSSRAAMKPEDITLIDPCMGSGHILAYAFDVLMQIYESYGYTTREAVASIVQNNLYGLDIDDRAAQLAYFAVMMKARQYDRRFFSRGLQPHVYAILESNGVNAGALDYFANGEPQLVAALDSIVNDLRDAKEYGSILTVAPVDFAALYARADEIYDDINLYREEALATVLPLIRVAEVLAQQYDVVVTNPPYMGSSGMGGKLAEYVKKHYPDSKSDLFAVFMEACGKMTKRNGYQAMITQHAWMFLSSFEKLRAKLLLKDTVNMAHLGPRAFEEIGGEVVQTTSFVLRNSHIADYKGTYCRLIEPTTQQGKEEMYLAGENRYTAQQSNFSKIPGSPVAYWVSDHVFSSFSNISISKFGWASKGIITGDNARFLRLWYEPSIKNIQFEANSYEDTLNCSQKWYPCNKGGEFRKWYGNYDYIINWYHNGEEVMQRNAKKVRNCQDYKNEYKFIPAITWTSISSSKSSFRLSKNALSESAGMTLFVEQNKLSYILGFLNSAVAEYILGIINPTLNFTAGSISDAPLALSEEYTSVTVSKVDSNIKISGVDWDSYETSWDFKRHPMV